MELSVRAVPALWSRQGANAGRTCVQLRQLRMSDALAILALVALGISDLLKFDWSWDTLAYHLPFAALRTGLIPPEQLVLLPNLHARFLGFPALINFVQGGLWCAFGRPEAASLVAPIAIGCFAAYACLAFGVGMVWSVAIFLAIPILHTALDSSYVDLWTNAFFAVHLLAAYRTLCGGTRRPLLHAVISNLALLVAVNSKPQFYVIGAVSFGMFAILLGVQSLRRRVQGNPQCGAALALATSLVLSPLVLHSPLKNAALLSNPIYPFKVAVAGVAFPGPEIRVWEGPANLSRVPAGVRYVLSQLDFQALSRPGGYSNDQGELPKGADGVRMGGSLSVLLIGSAAVLALALAKTRLQLAQIAVIAAFCTMVVGIANLSGSNELRYFSFVNIVIVFAALATLKAGADNGDSYIAGLFAAFRAFLIGSILFTGFVTGWRHVLPFGMSAQRIIDQSGDRSELLDALQRSDTICYTRADPNALLFAPVLNRSEVDRPYKLVEASSRSGCPPGSAVIE